MPRVERGRRNTSRKMLDAVDWLVAHPEHLTSPYRILVLRLKDAGIYSRTTYAYDIRVDAIVAMAEQRRGGVRA